MKDSKGREVVYTGKVYATGGYEGVHEPDSWQYMADVVDSILMHAASPNGTAPIEERLRFNSLRRELFRLFPEKKAAYIDDPVAAMDRVLPPKPSPRHTWDPASRTWELYGGSFSGPAINLR